MIRVILKNRVWRVHVTLALLGIESAWVAYIFDDGHDLFNVQLEDFVSRHQRGTDAT
mgnify:CR=1 FL=1